MLSSLAISVVVLLTASDGDVPSAVVTGELVCQVKDALGSSRYGWSRGRCERVAAALREAADPVEMLAVCINESDLRARAVFWASPSKGDAGLCGVRCVLDDRGHCTNGLVRGMRLEELYDPALNVRVAAQILAAKGSTSRYAGETVDRGYGRRVAVLVAALSGISASPRGRRMRDHVRRIVEAVTRVPRS